MPTTARDSCINTTVAFRLSGTGLVTEPVADEQQVSITLRLVLVTDAPLFLEGLVAAFEQAGHDPVGCSAATEDVAAAVAQHRPHVCLLALSVVGQALVQAAERLKDVAPDVPVLALTELAAADLLRPMLDVGVKGFVDRSVPLPELLAAAARVASGELVLDAALLLRAVRPERTPARGHRPSLTAREHEVLARMAAGDGTAEIATALNIQPSTARRHVENLRHKLGVHTRLQAVASVMQGPHAAGEVGARA